MTSGVQDGDPGPLLPTLELDDFAPYFIRAIANRLGQAASRLYHRKYGIGLTEWSCLSTLAKEQEISASRVCEMSGFDKGLVSRAIRLLEAKRLIETTPVKTHNRKRLIRFTPAGRALYVEIERLALVREERLLEGVSPDARAALMGYLQLMLRNASAMAAEESTTRGKGASSAEAGHPAPTRAAVPSLPDIDPE
jgi:DNA-binding MarR family transcriptional regulator